MMRVSIIITLIVLVFTIAMPARPAELLTMLLCKAQDFSEENRKCTIGKGLQGEGIVIDRNSTEKIYLLTVLRTDEIETISHVWFFRGSRMPQSKPTIYSESKRSFIDKMRDELKFLKGKDEVGITGSIAAVVDLLINPSARYRTWSSKILGKEWIGNWKVQVYNGSPHKGPRGEIFFEVK